MASSSADIASLLQQAGLPPGPVPGSVAVAVGGEQMTVQVEPWAAGCTLTATTAVAGLPPDTVSVALATMELAGAGDTRLDTSADGLRARRNLVGPGAHELREALHDLAKTILQARNALQTLTAAANEEQRINSISPPTTGEQPDIDRTDVDSPLLTVRAAQPAWAAPDPASSPIGELQAGQSYRLLRREGDWALVLTPDDEMIYTDGRTLVPPSSAPSGPPPGPPPAGGH